MSNGLEEANKAITEVCEALKTSEAIPRAIDAFREFLLAKNKAYGNSIYEPVRVFTSASIDTLILVRLNDKATRLLKGESGGEDSFDDLLGYLILRKALPLYLESKEARERGGDETSHSWALDGLTDEERNDPDYVAHLKMVAANIDIADRRRTVPGHVVTQSLRDRGLRVGMTFEEVRANKWTECEAESFEHPAPCTEGDPCSACKFLDGALCKCGHPFTMHSRDTKCCVDVCWRGQCPGFSLASWTPERADPRPTIAELEAMLQSDAPMKIEIQPNGSIRAVPNDAPSQIPPMTEAQRKARAECKGDPCSCDWEAPHGVDTPEGVRTQSGEFTEEQHQVIDALAEPPAKKPRVNRATWHETKEGADAIEAVLCAIKPAPQRAWYSREIADATHLDRSAVDLALTWLVEHGGVVKHGKAKGTRYAVAGFTDWPAPTPRKRASNELPVGEADADAAHSLDASDSEET